MRGTAHLIIGACAGAAISVVLLGGGRGLIVPAALVGVLGGLLPDIDHPRSTLGRLFPWPVASTPPNSRGFVRYGRRWFGRRTIWHRGETHSLGAAAIAGTGAFILFRWLAHAGLPVMHPGILALALITGYLSHLAADLCNISPLMLGWPLSRRMVRLPWNGVRENSMLGHVTEWTASLVAIAVMWSVLGGKMP